MQTTNKRNLAILGSTGSIGRQTLDVVAEYPDLFNAWLLVANRSADLLIEQALKFRPKCVVIADENYFSKVNDALSPQGIKVCTGASAIEDMVTAPEIDTVVTAVVGSRGSGTRIKGIKDGPRIGLANKESHILESA